MGEWEDPHRRWRSGVDFKSTQYKCIDNCTCLLDAEQQLFFLSIEAVSLQTLDHFPLYLLLFGVQFLLRSRL
jgi:hypothetical protein